MRSKGSHSGGSGSSGSNLYGVTLAPKRLTLYLSIIIVLLLSCHVGLTIYHYQIEELPWLPWRQLFDVDEENNLPTWFSGFLLSIVAVCVWLCARRKRSDRDSWQVHWYALAIGFLLLSVDEIAGLHETVNSPYRHELGHSWWNSDCWNRTVFRPVSAQASIQYRNAVSCVGCSLCRWCGGDGIGRGSD